MFNWAFQKIAKLREKVAVDLGGGDVEKPFLDHLDDLRTMLVRMCVTLLVVTLGSFFFYEELVKVVTYPLYLSGIADKLNLQNFKVTGGFMMVMNICLIAGVIVAFPLLLYFLLQFVLPGLRTNEKKVLFPAMSVGAGLFLLGVVFAYTVVTPRALQFFYEFNVGISSFAGTEQAQTQQVGPQPTLANSFGILWEVKNPGVKNTVEISPDGKTWSTLTTTDAGGKAVEAKDFQFVRITSAPVTGDTAPPPPPADVKPKVPMTWELTDYVKFICRFVLIFGICFELPVVVMALVKLDVLSYGVMKTSRTWAAIIITAIAAIITPTQDALTLGLLAVPMYVLYEICIWLAWYLEKKDRQLYPEYYKEQDEAAKEIEVSDDWDNENYNPWNEDGSDDEELTKSATTSAATKPAAASDEPATPSSPAPTPESSTDELPPSADAVEDASPGKPADDSSADEEPPEEKEKRNTD